MTMLKGGIYSPRWFVPWCLARYLPSSPLFFTRISLAKRMEIAWWRCSLWTADRLPWFARKIAINTLVGREILRDFMPLCHEQPNFNLCVRW